MPDRTRQVAALGVFLLVVAAAAGLGGLLTSQSVSTWYQTLERPAFTPPDWVFQPVWTMLYLAMAVAAWLVWRKGGPHARTGLAAFAVQLVLNVLWSALFFGLRSPGAGLADIVALWLAILATVVCFFRVSTAAGILMLPYLAWVTFAGALNFAIWQLN